ncbi:WD40 repeat domain-containing protein [Aspergillus foveolatus]|uniref:WD40 repeat domain-containing protein n=1 Tax=Aspergillus foveolatus TaxID=210207 RepID=UPI003CCCDC1B
MDGLSLTGSVIAVIQLTGSIVEPCGGYIQQVKHARDVILTLQRAITGLRGTLQDLQNLVESNNRKSFPTSSRLVSNITSCLSDLRALETKLEPGKCKTLIRKVGWRALKWPLKRADMESIIGNLERYKSSFILFGAAFESFADRDEAQCLQSTRTVLLQQIMDWAISPSQKNILWLKGMARTGKSTISRTVANLLKDTNHLGASFFSKRGEGDWGNAKKFFPTLTRQLLMRILGLRSYVQDALQNDPDITAKSLREHDQESDELEQQQLLQEFQNIIGVVILLAVPLSINALSRLLGIGADTISTRLVTFQSVLSVPGDRDLPVRILHLSFRDLLVRSSIKFYTMRGHLRKDICNLAHPGMRRADIEDQAIRQYLPPELQYSCRYWIYHLKQRCGLFLQKHFLHWMEVMSLLGLISEVVGMLDFLYTDIIGNNHSVFVNFLHDAKRFVLKNHQIADEAPLQIYCAGLVFAPQTSIIYTDFKDDFPSWICQLPKINQMWMTFLPDGRLLASGSNDKKVRLWDTATGSLQQTLSTREIVTEPHFSQDGSYINTNLGQLNIHARCGEYISSLSKANPEILVDERNWIVLNGRHVLWLPPEARVSYSAVKSDIFALAHASGRVFFIGFRIY